MNCRRCTYLGAYDTLDSLLSLADKSGEDFVIAGCFGFGEYEELLQTT